MEEPLGGHAGAEADQVTRFTAETVAVRQSRVAGWVFIALGLGCILFGGIFFAAKHSGHDVVATVTHAACTDVCTVNVLYDTPGGQVSAVMYGVPTDDLYGPPAHRLLNITYDSGDEANPTTNDMPDAIWIGFGAAGLVSAGFGGWLLRHKGSPRVLTQAPAGALARTTGRGPRWVDDRSGDIAIAERFSRWKAILFTLAGAILLGCVVADNSRTWLARGHIPVTVACLVIVAAALIWNCLRAWRIELRLGAGGVTVRNLYRTYRISWPEVLCFADGSVNAGESGRLWALDVVLRDGRVVTASGTARSKRDARPETLTAIRQAAQRYAIPAEVTGTAAKRGSRGSPANPGLYPDPGGQAGLRNWDGKQWSPFLVRADPASADPDKVNAPAEVWSPLAGSDPQWHDAPRRIRRAGIWFAVWLVVTAAAAAVTVELYARDLSKPQADFSLAVLALCGTGLALAIALGTWQTRKNLKKIDRAAKAAENTDGPVGQQTAPRHSRRKALVVVVGVGVVMLVAVVTVIGVMSSPTASTNQLTVDQLRSGDCLAGSNMGLGNASPWPDYVTPVACTNRHIAEVFFAGNIWPQSLAFPGDGAVGSQSDAHCNKAFVAYDGIDNSQSAFTYDYIVPASSDWASGDRLLVCVAYESTSQHPGGEPVNYSIKGSNK